MKSLRMSAAINGMVRQYENLLLTASEFEKAADTAKRMVRSAEMKKLNAQAKDFVAGEGEDFAAASEE